MQMRDLMAVVLLSPLASTSGAASFDCARARSATEKIICADQELAPSTNGSRKPTGLP